MEITKGENANLAGMEPPEGKVRNFDDPETIVDHIVGMVADDGSITDVARELAIDYVRTRLLYAGLERLAYIVEEKLTDPAGMEPRCPKCSAKVEFVMLSDSAAGIAAMCANDHRFPLYKGLDDCHVFFRTPVLRCPCCESENVTLEQNEIARWVACHNPKCGLTHHVSTNPELAQFFRSPAPTPPLDVEAEKRITEIRERESKATKGPWVWRKCYEIGRRHWAIKSPESEADGRVVGVMGTLAFDDFTPPDKWHADPNNQFIAHARLDIPFLLEQISLLRRHAASPAPRSCPKCGSPMCQPYKSTDDDLWTQRCNKCEWFEKWSGLASPAQPEKRDE